MADGNSEQGTGGEVKPSSPKSPEVKNPLKVVEKIFGFLANLIFGSGTEKTQNQAVLELPQIRQKAQEIDTKLEKDGGKIKKEKPGAFEAVKTLTGNSTSLEAEPASQKLG